MRPLTLSSKNPFHQKEQSLLFRCKDEQGQSLLLKILNTPLPSSAAIRQFYEEYELTQSLKTPNIRRVLEKGIWEGKPALLLEYVEATTLKKIAAFQPLPLTSLLKIAIQLANTLEKIHQEKIIHKDISSENILVNLEKEKVAIIDFGIATRLNLKTIYLGNPIHVQGNLSYISPEQTGRMNRTLDYRSDLYSLGVVLFEMLTGRLPFIKEDPLELVHCHLAITPPSPLDLLDSSLQKTPLLLFLSKVILKLLSKDADERYQSAKGLKIDLEQCMLQLQASNDSIQAVVGAGDFTEKFQIPQKLYGREMELAILTHAYQSTSQGNTKLLLVSGYSGVGKSSLVYEIHKPITANRGYFIEGKFDQFQKNLPYYAWIQAFENLINLLLTESQSKLENWKERLLLALDGKGAILTKIIPSLEKIIGQQPTIPELDPADNQKRFNHLIRQFIKCFASEEHPLFIFLDDWQWTDMPSLHLLEMLLTDSNFQYLMITGAYRNNEVPVEHPFYKTVEKLKMQAVSVLSISLNNLTLTNINHLVSETLYCDLPYSQLLSQLLFSKTRGNAFFLRQMLQSLYDKKLLKLYFSEQNKPTWKWDIEEIQQLKISDNVVDLMVEKSLKLPLNTQKVLQLASCIGTLFPLNLLSLIYQENQEITYQHLFPALEEGMVIPIREQFTFSHDRIQQAVYSLIPKAEKNHFHYQIGKLSLKHFRNSDSNEWGSTIFDIVNQLNFGLHLIRDADKLQLADLNFQAGKQAKQANAYGPALHYLQIGQSLLPKDGWEKNYEITLKLHRHLAECEALSYNFEKAEALFRLCFEKAQQLEEKLEVAELQIWLSWWVGKLDVGVSIGKQALALCGLHFPDSGKNTIKLIKEEERSVQKLLGNKGVSQFRFLPEMTEPIQIWVTNILSRLSFLLYIRMGHNRFYQLSILFGARITLQYGRLENTAVLLAHYCAVLAGQDRYKDVYQLAIIAMEIADAYPHFHAKSQFLNRVALWGLIYGQHIKHSNKIFEEGYQIGTETGNVPHAATCMYDLLMHYLASGTPLKEVIAQANKVTKFLDKIGYKVVLIYTVRDKNLAIFLKDGKIAYDEAQKVLKDIKIYNLDIEKSWRQANSIIMHLFSGAFGKALQVMEKFKTEIIHATSNIKWADYDFYAAITLTTLFPSFSSNQQKKYQNPLKLHRKRMKLRAEVCPDNFECKHLLIEAELKRIEGYKWEAAELYEKSIASARKYGFTHIEALANELAGKFWHKLDQANFAQLYIQNAWQCYQNWDAWYIAQRLATDFPSYLSKSVSLERQNSGSTSFTELDLASILNATQVLSSEVILSNLLPKMMKIVIENSGAERGVFIEQKAGEFYLKAEGNATQTISVFKEGLSLYQSRIIPISIINYVGRTKESLILNNASKDRKFAHDLYLQAHQPKSILCFPIQRKGQLTAILYLENNQTINVFTEQRLEILQALTAQIGISFENALLYENLQQSLQQQTLLSDAYRKFVPHAFLKNLGHQNILDIKLGDQIYKEVSVMFMDIRDYTSLSENMNPKENFDFLNAYFRQVGSVIESNNGFINQYYGDGIMALFLEHPKDALKAAVAIQEKIENYNVKRAQKGRKAIQIGIGVHFGRLMFGIIGNEHHLQASVVSDAVNTASRLEGLTKYYKTKILVSGALIRHLENPTKFHHRFLGKVQVKGKKNNLMVYEVFQNDQETIIHLKAKANPFFQQALTCYFNKDFQAALHLFQQALELYPNDEVIQNYLVKTKENFKQGVSSDWTGVEVMHSK